MGLRGEIFVLDMGEPVRSLTWLSILSGSLASAFRGDRHRLYRHPTGRKALFGQLLTAEERVGKTRRPKIFMGKVVSDQLATLTEKLERLVEFGDRWPPAELRASPRSTCPKSGGRPSSTPVCSST